MLEALATYLVFCFFVLGAVGDSAERPGSSTSVLEETRVTRFFGYEVAALEDVDGDGIDDIAVAAAERSYEVSRRRVVVFSGASGELLCEITSEPFLDVYRRSKALTYMPCVSLSLSSGGDMDGDGYGDLLIGVHQPFKGRVGSLPNSMAAVYSVRNKKVIHRAEGETPGDGFGRSVTLVGDVDRDGAADWIVGAPGGSHGSWPRARGYAHVRSGRDGSLIARLEGELYEEDSAHPDGDLFGYFCCPLGDLDGDGHADFAISAPRGRFESKRHGRVAIYSGKECSQVRVLHGGSIGDFFGGSIVGNDFDLDGLSELVVGSVSRCAQVFAGESNELIKTLSPHTRFFLTGFAGQIAGVGDVNGDGHPDLGIGALPLYPHDLNRCHIVSGKDWREIFHIDVEVSSAIVQGCGDLDRDGNPDVLLGIPGQKEVRVVSGVSGQAIHSLKAP